VLAAFALAVGCSGDDASGGTAGITVSDGGAGAADGGGEDTPGLDAAGLDAGGTDAGVDAVADGSGGADGGADAGGPQDAASGDVADPDAAGADVEVVQIGPRNPVGTMYAHTSSALYKLDLFTKKFAKVGNFSFSKKKGSVTDIALDKIGTLYAITFNDVFRCNEITAKCLWLATLPQSFNGLTFVPAGTVDKSGEALIGIGNSGTWNHIKVSGNKATIKQLGTYGGGWQSSGDAFSVEGIGTFATVNGAVKGGGDRIVSVDPKTGKMLKVIGDTGATALWGLAWWGNVFYGFSSSGKVYNIDAKTGKSTVVTGMQVPKGASWWGAGVSTRAAGGP